MGQPALKPKIEEKQKSGPELRVIEVGRRTGISPVPMGGFPTVRYIGQLLTTYVILLLAAAGLALGLYATFFLLGGIITLLHRLF